MSISRLEPTRQFINRVILLNRFHAPDQEDYSNAHKPLGHIHGTFPDGPIGAQCAHIIVSMVRDKPFDEANFRTAWDYVADMLGHHEYDLRASLSEAQELGHNVWEQVDESDDDLFDYVAQWFQPRIHRVKGAAAATLN